MDRSVGLTRSGSLRVIVGKSRVCESVCARLEAGRLLYGVVGGCRTGKVVLVVERDFRLLLKSIVEVSERTVKVVVVGQLLLCLRIAAMQEQLEVGNWAHICAVGSIRYDVGSMSYADIGRCAYVIVISYVAPSKSIVLKIVHLEVVELIAFACKNAILGAVFVVCNPADVLGLLDSALKIRHLYLLVLGGSIYRLAVSGVVERIEPVRLSARIVQIGAQGHSCVIVLQSEYDALIVLKGQVGVFLGAAFAQCGLYLIGKISCRTDVEDIANGKGRLLGDVICASTFADSTVNISAYIAGNGLACPVSSIGS